MPGNDELAKRREAIDRIDEEILRLLSARAAEAAAIGKVKTGAIYRPEREAMVLRRLQQLNNGPLPNDAIASVFRSVISACIALERPLRLAYLGPAGTFSEAATIKGFGESATRVPVASIDEAFRDTEAGATDYAIVPVENSTEGAIGRTLDLLLTTPLQICGEIVLRVHQNVLRKGTGLEGVERVYSHAQSLSQCTRWLALHLPGVELVPVASNADAARLAAGEPGACAIAGELAAQRYGLDIVAGNIEDEANNTTRFLVIGKHDAGRTGIDKTSFAMSAQNRPGAVHELLAPLAEHGVSMTKLESRPSRAGLWEYFFFVDVDGHREDARVAEALQAVGKRAASLKIFGSYPVAPH
jgi:chorismate mutase / prephenate dehydratase